MRSKRWIVMALLVVVTTASISGCAPEQPEPEQPGETVVEQTVVVKETVVVRETEQVVEEVVVTATPAPPDMTRIEELKVGQFGDPVTLDCWDWTSVDELDILQHIAEPMFRFDRAGQVHGVVVEDWEMVDTTEWVLHLRQGMKFHDPEYGELTAEDVVASLDACFDPEARAVKKQAGVVAQREVEIVDDYTLRVKFPEPGTAALPNLWTYTAISSKEYLEQVGKDFTRKPMGTGPIRFVEWVPNVRVVGERFEDYWGEAPAVDRVVWRVIPDAFTRKSEFMTGGLDILPFMVADWVPEVKESPDVRVESVLSARYIMVVLPCGEPPYNDQRVRQALNYAVNKEEIVEQLFQGVGATMPRGVVNPIIPESDPDRVIYPYDPDKAMELLDEARADGVEIPPLTLYAPNDRYVMDKEMGEAVAGYWRALGLEVEYIPESRTTLFPRTMGLDMTDPFLVGFGNTQMRADYPFSLWLQKRSDPVSRGAYYAQAPDEWDDMIAELVALPSGSEESIELARELDELFIDYAQWVYVVNFVDLFGVAADVDWAPYPFESRYLFDVAPME